ncbi:MAG TPA: hypothetical protein DDW56_22160 [Cyanobacteria bacterium UBA11366]|nr:hypothetical protein [Cyanobacteria bacterium UBA11366]HBK62690.1 hypothetical protein [Cyanobacteria bacterium UBA11166]
MLRPYSREKESEKENEHEREMKNLDINEDNVGVKHLDDMMNRETNNIHIQMLHPALTRGLR